MPIPKRRVKQETRVAKIAASGGRSKATEQTGRGSPKDTRSAAQASSPSVCQSRRAKLSVTDQSLQQQNQKGMLYVPVVSKDGKPLMPAKASRVKKWLKSGKAIKRWNKGMFFVKLTVETEENLQPIVIAIDPGSKWEGFTVKSRAHTYYNSQSDAVTWVGKRMEIRANMRRGRRFRKTPCRKPRFNRQRNQKWLSPSTKARWQLKKNIVNWFKKVYPICHIVVENIKANTKQGQRKWNKTFSQLEIGKNWFYSQLEKIVPISLKQGFETFELRKALGLRKSGNKSEKFLCSLCGFLGFSK